MESAAYRLPSLNIAPPEAPDIFFLTGSAFWYQTAFCAYSLVAHAQAPLRVVVVDDGTLAQNQTAELQRIFPGLRLIGSAEVDRRLDAHLPIEHYPNLRRRRIVYPHLRKLTDIHAGGTGWKLVLDSDMLFCRYPRFLLEWLKAPERPCHMTDVEDSYGYSSSLMTDLAGAPIPPRVNVGICGLRSEDIDWKQLETWCGVMLEREGSHYLQEQALVAMLLAKKSRSVAPPDEYVVRPTRAESEHPAATLYHFVAESKSWYFRFGWQQCFSGIPQVPVGRMPISDGTARR